MISRRYDNIHSSLTVYSFDDEFLGYNWKLISDLYTDKEYRRCGYAKELIEKVVDEYFEDGVYLLVRINNDSAISLYVKCGFNVFNCIDNHLVMIAGNGDLDALKEMKFKI